MLRRLIPWEESNATNIPAILCMAKSFRCPWGSKCTLSFPSDAGIQNIGLRSTLKGRPGQSDLQVFALRILSLSDKLLDFFNEHLYKSLLD